MGTATGVGAVTGHVSHASLQSAVGLNINIKPTAAPDGQSAMFDLHPKKPGTSGGDGQQAILATQ